MKWIYHSQVFTVLTILTNYSVDVTVTVDTCVNCSIYIFGFYDFFCYSVGLYIFEPLKYLMKPESINSIDTVNSLSLCMCSLILFFHVFVKHKWDLKLKYVLVALVFSPNFYFVH